MPAPNSGIARAALNVANRLARPFDALAAVNSSDSPAPIMVVGLPRSGTTLVYELLVQAFEVGFLTRLYSYTYGIPSLSTRLVANRIRNPHARFDSNYGRIPGRFAPAENAVFWDRWFVEHEVLGHHVPSHSITDQAIQKAKETLSSMTAIAGRPYVFKNVYMALSVPAFLRLLPDSRAIVVTRDIDAIVASVHKGRGSRSGWWSIRPPFADDVDDKSNLEQTVFQCIRSQQLLEHSLTTVEADRVLIVDYAAACADPRSFIEDVARWTSDSFNRRGDPTIPDRFALSAGPGLAAEDKARFDDYMKSLDESRAQYVSRVESFVVEHPTDV